MENLEYFLIPSLAFVAAVTIGGAMLVARAGSRKPIEERLRRLGEEDASVAGEGVEARQGLLARIARAFAPGKPSESLKAQLARAGFHDSSAAAVYLGSKVLLLLLGSLTALAVMVPMKLSLPPLLLVTASSGILLSFVPNLVVHVAKQKRRDEIRHHLPDAVDLLEICVSAGMGLDMAWNSVADEVRRVSTILADEMALTNLEMHLGASRTVALRHMVDRTGADELGSLVAVLVQSERFGTGMAEALKVFAATMREARSTRAEESAEKMAVKLLFPMVFFIFPVMLIVLAGPAILLLVKYLGTR
jgi:tight adherence protein C